MHGSTSLILHRCLINTWPSVPPFTTNPSKHSEVTNQLMAIKTSLLSNQQYFVRSLVKVYITSLLKYSDTFCKACAIIVLCSLSKMYFSGTIIQSNVEKPLACLRVKSSQENICFVIDITNTSLNILYHLLLKIDCIWFSTVFSFCSSFNWSYLPSLS